VAREGPAARAGLKAGDLLIEVNGKMVNDVRGLTSAIASYRPGNKIEVKVLSNGREKTFSIVVEEKR
jgi:serine protease Do